MGMNYTKADIAQVERDAEDKEDYPMLGNHF